MQRSWTTSGRALHLELDPSLPRRTAIERALRAAIRAGALATGAPLPATRALAQDLGVARGTVVEAYDQLITEGYLAARHGSGTVVAWSGAKPARVGPSAPRAAAAPSPYRFSFKSGSPDVSSFPRAPWLAALRAALARAPDAALDYGDPRGLPALRAVLADYLGRARGVVVGEEEVVVCSSAGQALGLLARVLRAAGAERIAVEDPGLPELRRVLEAGGLAWRAVPVDGEGLVTGALQERDGAVMVTPAHQFPMGVTLSPARRAALVEWARRREAWIIEDDYDGEFRYDRQPVGALQALEPSRVIYVGTASKVLAPGVRLAWVAAPRALVTAIAEAKRLSDRQAPTLEQLALAELIRSGAFERHLRRMRREYRRRRDALLAAVARSAPRLSAAGIAAGLHLVLPLPPEGPAEAAVEAAAAARGVEVRGLGEFGAGAAPAARGVVVGYGSPPASAFDAALAALAAALAEVCGGEREDGTAERANRGRRRPAVSAPRR